MRGNVVTELSLITHTKQLNTVPPFHKRVHRYYELTLEACFVAQVRLAAMQYLKGVIHSTKVINASVVSNNLTHLEYLKISLTGEVAQLVRAIDLGSIGTGFNSQLYKISEYLKPSKHEILRLVYQSTCRHKSLL